MKKIITILLLVSLYNVKAQNSEVYEMSHYTIDDVNSTFTNINFITIGNEEVTILYIKNMDTSFYLLEEYPLVLMESGYKNEVYFKKYVIDKNSPNFISESKRNGSRCYYFFYESKGGKIKSIAELVNYKSSDNIISKRYYP